VLTLRDEKSVAIVVRFVFYLRRATRGQAAWPHHQIAILLHVNADIIFLLK